MEKQRKERERRHPLQKEKEKLKDQTLEKRLTNRKYNTRREKKNHLNE